MKKALLVVMFGALVACEGPEGPPGPQGPQGPRGPDGFGSALFCQRIYGNALFIYELVRYIGGDGIATCSIEDAASTYSSTTFLWAGTISSNLGECAIIYDVDSNPSAGFWQFRGDTKAVRYFDTGSPYNGSGFTFVTNDCETR